MRGATAIAIGALLLAVLLLLVAALLWQEARKRSQREAGAYIVEDAVSFVLAGLAAPVRRRLGRDDVRRILEWEVYYLQGLAHGKRDRRQGVTVVAGGHDEAVSFIVEQIAARNKVRYRDEDVRAVLGGEAGYLASIGAVGAPVAGGEI